jgi:diguanylate cyclase (GGDEF)-like protein
VPLEGSRGVVGVIVLYHEETDAFTRDHLRMLLALAPRLGQAVENALKYRETEERANRDPLTQLPNGYLLTRSLDAELARARRLRQPLAVMVCTMGGLQALCDEMGAAAGEQVVQTVACALKEDCREYDHLGVTGPGEFAFVLPGMKRDYLGAKVTRLGEIAAEADNSAGNTISFCIGEAFYPDDGDTARHLLSLAKRRSSQHRSEAPSSTGLLTCVEQLS